jgi:hypothetical protein
MNFLDNKKLGQQVTFFILLLLWLILIIAQPHAILLESKLAILFYGIGKLLLILGFIVFVIIWSWQQRVLRIKEAESEKEVREHNFRRTTLDKQMEDAEKRRKHDQIMRYDAALARFFEISIVKNEDVTQPVDVPEGISAEAQKLAYKKTQTRNQFDKDAFELVFNKYKDIISEQKTK